MDNTLGNKKLLIDFSQIEPNKKAVIYKNESISYNELKDATISLSTELKRLGVERGDFVAIHISNSIEMVLSIFAILKCNAIILPINIDLPTEQISHILSKSNPKIILHNQNIQFDLNYKNATAYYVDYKRLNKKNNSNNSLFVYEPNDLAYCIFTSGSSGIPKRVLLTYEGILNHIEAKVNLLNLTSENRLCLSFNIGFVASIWQILTPILLRAQLYIYDNNLIKKPYQFFEQLERDEINVVSMIPQSLYVYCQYIGDKHQKLALPHMKHVILTGEKVEKNIVYNFFGSYKHISLINAYGQSECSDDTFHFEIPRNFDESDIPIGKPIPNISHLILNEDLKDVTNGEKGELLIGGICLAQSHLNNEQLISEKFVTISNEIFYRTGDIVKLNQNNDVVYLGRTDNQIKIRGYLVEPEEIETYLNQIFGINQSVIISIETNEVDRMLAAYFTSDNDINSKEITEHLSSKLPAYMIPSIIKRVESFFLNSNGKVDRKRVLECIEIKEDYTKEYSSIDERLNDVQKRAFDVIISNVNDKITETISVNTNFKNIGLNSLTFIETVVNLETEFDFEFDHEKLLTEFPTIKSMIEYVESKVQP